MKMQLSADHFSAKKSTVIYILIAAAVAALIIVLIALKLKDSDEKNFTNGYDKVYSFGSYSVKLNSMKYLSDLKQLNFVYYSKPTTSSITTSAPTVIEVRLVYDEKGEDYKSVAFSSESLNEIQRLYSSMNVDITSVRAVMVFIEYKDNGYYDADITDEFGDVIKGQYHEGQVYQYYFTVDIKDIPTISSTEYKVPQLNSSDLDNATSLTSTITPGRTIQSVSSEPDSEEITPDTSISEKEIQPMPSTSSATNAEPMPSATTTKTTIATTSAAATREEVTIRTDNTSSKTTTKALTGTVTQPTAKTTTQSITTKATTKITMPSTTTTTTAATTKATTKITTKAATQSIASTTTTAAIHTNKLALNVYVVELKLGNSSQVSPVYEPINSTDTFSWSSNRTDRVIVDQNGKVTGVGTGSAIITCTDNENGLTASCMVTVN